MRRPRPAKRGGRPRFWAQTIHVSFAEGATMLKETDVEVALANCRALINQINAGVSLIVSGVLTSKSCGA
jgi:hypothetical protein